MKKLLNYGHPGFYCYVLGLVLLFMGIWLPDAAFWMDFEKYSNKVFNTWFTLSQISIGLGIALFLGGLLWINSSEKSGK